MASTSNPAARRTTPAQDGADTNGDAQTALREKIVSETKHIEKDCRVAVRCHGTAATRWTHLYYVLGLPTAVLAALAGVSAINDLPVLAAALATLATVFAATNTFLNAGQMANAHGKKRSEYEQLKNEIRLFRNITLPTQRLERELFRELARHSKTRDVLNLESPQVSNRAHRKAARALERQRAQEEQEAQAAKNETSEAASSLALQDPR